MQTNTLQLSRYEKPHTKRTFTEISNSGLVAACTFPFAYFQFLVTTYIFLASTNHPLGASPASHICHGDLKRRSKLPGVLVSRRDVLVEGRLRCRRRRRGARHLHLEDAGREEHQSTAVTELLALLQLHSTKGKTKLSTRMTQIWSRSVSHLEI